MNIRLQKFMADCGIASRRKCEELITQGQVRVNGEIKTTLPILIDPDSDQITVGEQLLEPIKQETHAYYLLHKPKGVLVTNHDPADRKTVGELMTGITERVFPVGRLDMDARGLLMMTNDGELAHRLTHPRYGVEKTYVVRVDGRMGADAIERLRKGVWLGPEQGAGPGVKSEGFRLRLLARDRHDTVLEVRLVERKNREIRRVLARTGHKVRDLFRVAMAEKITLKGLEPGQFRRLTEQEVAWLRKATSADFHEQKRAATQAWFENKEMAKERRRIAAEAGQRRTAPGRPAVSRAPTGLNRPLDGAGRRPTPSPRPPARSFVPGGARRMAHGKFGRDSRNFGRHNPKPRR